MFILILVIYFSSLPKQSGSMLLYKFNSDIVIKFWSELLNKFPLWVELFLKNRGIINIIIDQKKLIAAIKDDWNEID